MEHNDPINELIEKYLEASTSVAEERELKAYFNSERVAPEHESYRPLFQYFSEAKKERLNEPISIKPRKKIRFGWISVAASVVLVMGLYFGNQYKVAKEQEQIEAQLAYEETKKALNLLAVNLGKGTQKMAYLNEFETTKSKVFNKN